MLGTIPALRADEPVGVLFVDGHEDTMPLDVSEDGEAANTEIGLLLGLTGNLMHGPLSERFPAQGLPDIADEPHGLNWDQLTRTLNAAVARRLPGMQCGIYDPEQDPDRFDSHRIVRLVADIMTALPKATS